MKLCHFTVLFAGFALLLLVFTGLKIFEEAAEERIGESYSRAFKEAVNDAVTVLLGRGEEGILNCAPEAADCFGASFLAGLGCTVSSRKMDELKLYIPVLLVTDGENCRIRYLEYGRDSENTVQLTECWTDELPAEGEKLESLLKEYCGRHNRIAGEAGISYRFTLPESDGGLFLRGSSGPGIYVILQGYPYSGCSGTYSASSFAGCGIRETEFFYVNAEGSGLDSPRYFHTWECAHRSDLTLIYSSRRECALAGAMECPDCGGDGYGY